MFISDTKYIADKFEIPIINLLASIVKHNDEGTKYTEYNSCVYDIMPRIFVEFATDCTYTEKTDSKIKQIISIPKKKPDFETSRLRDVRRYL